MRRVQATLLVTVLVLTIMSGIPASSSDEGSPEKTIGVYERWVDSGDLSEKHVTRDGKNLAIQGPSFTNTLRVDKEFLGAELGAWSTSTAFSFDGDHAVFNGRSADFAPLELGAEPVFTLGGRDQLEFQNRPMWVSVEQDEPGGQITLHMEDGDTTRQPIFIAKEWLWDRGIHQPMAVHEDGTNLSVERALGGDGWMIEMHHFSYVELTATDQVVYSRQEGLIVPHTGQQRWNEAEMRLEIDVGGSLDCASHVLAGCGSIDQDVIVDKDWLDMNIDHLALQGHVWEVNLYNLKGFGQENYYEVALTSSQTPTTIVYQTFFPDSQPKYTVGSPDSIELWSVNETTRETLVPITLSAENGPSLEIHVSGTGLYRISVNKSWLNSLEVQRPHFLVNGNHSSYFESFDATHWIVTLQNGGLIEEESDTSTPYLRENREQAVILRFDPLAQTVVVEQAAYLPWIDGSVEIILYNVSWVEDYWGLGNLTSIDVTLDEVVVGSFEPTFMRDPANPSNVIPDPVLSIRLNDEESGELDHLQDDLMALVFRHDATGAEQSIYLTDIASNFAPDAGIFQADQSNHCPPNTTFAWLNSFDADYHVHTHNHFIPADENAGSWAWRAAIWWQGCSGSSIPTWSGSAIINSGGIHNSTTQWFHDRFETGHSAFRLQGMFDGPPSSEQSGWIRMYAPAMFLHMPRTPDQQGSVPLATWVEAGTGRDPIDLVDCKIDWTDHLARHALLTLVGQFGHGGTIASFLAGALPPEVACEQDPIEVLSSMGGAPGGGPKMGDTRTTGLRDGGVISTWSTHNNAAPDYEDEFDLVFEPTVGVRLHLFGCNCQEWSDAFTVYWGKGPMTTSKAEIKIADQ